MTKLNSKDYKNMVKNIALAYYENTKRDDIIYESLKAVDIYISEINSPYTKVAETILSSVSEFMLSDILSFVNEGYVEIGSSKFEKIEDLIDYYLEEDTK